MTTTTAHAVEAGDHIRIPGFIPAPVLVEQVAPRSLSGYEFTELTVWTYSQMVSLTLAPEFPVQIVPQLSNCVVR